MNKNINDTVCILKDILKKIDNKTTKQVSIHHLQIEVHQIKKK